MTPVRALHGSVLQTVIGEWLSLVEHLVRDQGVGGSNPLSPTNLFKRTAKSLSRIVLDIIDSPRTLVSMPRNKNQKAVSFGKRLLALRRVYGLSQKNLAQILGASRRAIAYYEAEEALPGVELVITVARTFGISTDELLGLKPTKLRSNTAQEHRLRKRLFS